MKKILSSLLVFSMVLSMITITPLQFVEASSIQNVKMYADTDLSTFGSGMTEVVCESEQDWFIQLWHYSGGYWGGTI